MNTHFPKISPAFLAAANGLVALHQLDKDGHDESPEAESIRDALDIPLKALSRVEKERVQWLSEDLYSVSEPSGTNIDKEMNPQAQQQLILAYEARQNRNWDLALKLLRRWKNHISPALLSYMRGSIWAEVGVPHAASMFFGDASEKEPGSGNYLALYLHSLAKADSVLAMNLAIRILTESEKYESVVVARALEIRLMGSESAPTVEVTALCRELIPLLENNRSRMEAEEETVGRTSNLVLMLGLLGFCHETLGNVTVAIDCYTRGLRIDPINDGLLVARGTLLYGSSPRAVTDFEEAVRGGSPLVWPYLYLSHHYLITNRFEQCRAMCEVGLSKHRSDSIDSLFEEWRAIAQSALGFPREYVRAAFESAIRLNPLNELARRNSDSFEDFLRSPQSTTPTWWEQQSEATLKQFGLIERRYSPAA